MFARTVFVSNLLKKVKRILSIINLNNIKNCEKKISSNKKFCSIKFFYYRIHCLFFAMNTKTYNQINSNKLTVWFIFLRLNKIYNAIKEF